MKHKQSGYSLIELMIASVIGLVVLSGAVTIFTSNKASQSLSLGMSQVQENGRVALDIIANSIRLAGYQGLWGARFDGNNWQPARPTDLDEIGNKPTPDTDVIYVKHGSGRATILSTSMLNANANPITLARNPDQIDVGDLVMISDCVGSDIFRATTVTNDTTNVTVGFNAVENSQANLSRASA